jgi:hypothetical protein
LIDGEQDTIASYHVVLDKNGRIPYTPVRVLSGGSRRKRRSTMTIFLDNRK